MSDFEKAAEFARTEKFATTPSQDDLLGLYKYYKQATVGNCNIEQPGILHQRERAKWQAWDSVKGLNQNDAKIKYVEIVTKLDNNWNLKQ